MAARGAAKQTCCDHRSCYRRRISLPIFSASRLALFYHLLAITVCVTPSIISSCKHSLISSSTKGIQEDTLYRRQESTAADRASTNTGIGAKGEQGNFQSHNPSTTTTKSMSMSTPITKASSTASRSNGTFTDTAIDPEDVITSGAFSGKAMPIQRGLAAHTDLNSLAFLPIDSPPALTPNQSSKIVTAPDLNINIKQAEQPSSLTQQSKKSIPGTTASKDRKKGIRSGSLPDKYIQALRIAFGNSGYQPAIDNYGHLILNPDSGVNFASGSSEMTKASQEVVQKLVRLYAETLLLELNNESHAIHIAIKGYTNPRSDSNNTLTHNANRRISRKRAAMIRNILSDLKIWPNSNLSIEGRGEDNPISRVDNQVGPCGIYDCERSRRIELEATIK